MSPNRLRRWFAAVSMMLLLPCYAASPCYAAKQKQMMKIGDEVVNVQTGELFVRAQQAISSGNLEQAAELLKSFLQTQPASAAGRYKYSFVLLQQGKNAESLEQARRCVQLSPNSVNGWSIVGESSLNLGLKEQAEQAYRKALAIQPNGENADVIRERLDELTNKQQTPLVEMVPDPKNAEANLQIVKLNEALALCTKAMDHLKQGQFEQGLQECRDALKIAPESDRIKENYAAYLNNYAASCVQKQDYNQAELLMKEAIALQAKGGVTTQSKTTTLKNYTALLKFLNRSDEAKQVQSQLDALSANR